MNAKINTYNRNAKVLRIELMILLMVGVAALLLNFWGNAHQ